MISTVMARSRPTILIHVRLRQSDEAKAKFEVHADIALLLEIDGI